MGVHLCRKVESGPTKTGWLVPPVVCLLPPTRNRRPRHDPDGRSTPPHGPRPIPGHWLHPPLRPHTGPRPPNAHNTARHSRVQGCPHGSSVFRLPLSDSPTQLRPPTWNRRPRRPLGLHHSTLTTAIALPGPDVDALLLPATLPPARRPSRTPSRRRQDRPLRLVVAPLRPYRPIGTVTSHVRDIRYGAPHPRTRRRGRLAQRSTP